MTLSNKALYISKLVKEEKRLAKKIQKWTESDLDTYPLPHPLLGKMTTREIAI